MSLLIKTKSKKIKTILKKCYLVCFFTIFFINIVFLLTIFLKKIIESLLTSQKIEKSLFKINLSNSFNNEQNISTNQITLFIRSTSVYFTRPNFINF